MFSRYTGAGDILSERQTSVDHHEDDDLKVLSASLTDVIFSIDDDDSSEAD